MHNLNNVIKYELSKIFARKKYIFIPFIEIIFVLLLGAFSFFEKTLIIFSVAISLPNLPLTILSFFAQLIIPITIFMLVSDTISSEFENNTIKNIFLRPVSRFTIFIGKNISIVLYILVNLLLIFAACVLVSILGDINLQNIFTSLLAYLITIIPIMTFISFGTLVATNMKSSSMCMFSLLMIYIIISGVSMYSTKVYSILFTNYLGYYKLFLGTSLPVSHVINLSLLLFSNILIFFTLGFLSFDKKNI